MRKMCGSLNHYCPKVLRDFAILAFVTFFVTACTQSSSPTVEDLIKVDAPTVEGLQQKSYTTSSITFTVQGTCDMQASLTEYSVDSGSTWTTITCAASHYSVTVSMAEVVVAVQVRSRGKFTYTSAAEADLKLVMAPTSNEVAFVQSSASHKSDFIKTGTQNAIMSNFTTATITDGTVNIDSGVVEAAYAAP